MHISTICSFVIISFTFPVNLAPWGLSLSPGLAGFAKRFEFHTVLHGPYSAVVAISHLFSTCLILFVDKHNINVVATTDLHNKLIGPP